MSPWRLSGRLWVRLNQPTHFWQKVNPSSGVWTSLPRRWCRICTSLACPQTMNMAYSYRVNKDIHREGEDPFALWIHCFHNNKLHPKFTAKASLRHNVHHWHIILFTYFVGSPRHGREIPLHYFLTHGIWGCQEHLCSITEWSDKRSELVSQIGERSGLLCKSQIWTLKICEGKSIGVPCVHRVVRLKHRPRWLFTVQ